MIKRENNVKNHTCRVGNDFNKEVGKINDRRKELRKRVLSMRMLTNILIKHNSWHIIKQDLIRLDLENRNNGKNE